jgi:hypothetical protein
MDDELLVAAFESGQEPAGGFHHREHVRVAWYYLRQHAMPDALVRFSNALRAFATAQGKPGLYHETITTAYVLLINERLDDRARELSWNDFARLNPDLFAWKPSILDRYYRPDTLKSDKARRTFVMPDRFAADESVQ